MRCRAAHGTRAEAPVAQSDAMVFHRTLFGLTLRSDLAQTKLLHNMKYKHTSGEIGAV
jgi:hypothetical protein